MPSPALAAALQDSGNPDYDALPECVRHLYTFEQWQWLSHKQKAELVQRETEPEWDEAGP